MSAPNEGEIIADLPVRGWIDQREPIVTIDPIVTSDADGGETGVLCRGLIEALQPGQHGMVCPQHCGGNHIPEAGPPKVAVFIVLGLKVWFQFIAGLCARPRRSVPRHWAEYPGSKISR